LRSPEPARPTYASAARDLGQLAAAHLIERAAQLAIREDALVVKASENGLKQVAITTEGAKLADQGADLEDAPQRNPPR